MKVAINSCFGGFQLSVEALKELTIRNAKCIESYTPEDYYGGGLYWQNKWQKDFAEYEDIGDGFLSSELRYNLYKIEDGLIYSFRDSADKETRTDKDLIDVIEKMGEIAGTSCARLKIIEIPDDVDFVICEYDGNEHIAEKHITWS